MNASSMLSYLMSLTNGDFFKISWYLLGTWVSNVRFSSSIGVGVACLTIESPSLFDETDELFVDVSEVAAFELAFGTTNVFDINETSASHFSMHSFGLQEREREIKSIVR